MQAAGASSEEVNEYVGMLIDAAVNGFYIFAEKSPKSGKARPSPSNP